MGGRSSEAQLRRFFSTRSRATRAMLQTAARVVALPVNVLIVGETGSGKDYLAEAIHRAGPRKSAPFLRIDCGAVPRELFETELFGHEKGAFTDARHLKRGRLELAHGGSVYLDEIAALEPSLQPKLLRLLQERSFMRIGGAQSIAVDLRFIASTVLGLPELASGQPVRTDLFYRLNVVSIEVPPLRERPEDIPLLAAQFAAEAFARLKVEPRPMSEPFSAALRAHRWPGNIRELRNAMERAVLMCEGETLGVDLLPPEVVADVEAAVSLAAREHWTLEALERDYISRVMSLSGGNYSAAARVLGINRKTLLEKRKKYGL